MRWFPNKPNMNTLKKLKLFLRIISVSCSISALILISVAIATPNGIRFYEDRISVKIFEISISLLVIIYLLQEFRISIIDLVQKLNEPVKGDEVELPHAKAVKLPGS